MLRKCFAMLALLVMALVLPDGAEGEEQAPAAMIGVDGYELSCSWLLAENIFWETIPETEAADLRFTAQLREDLALPIFTMTMLQEQGDHVKILTDAQGDIVPVGFMMAKIPDGLSPQEQQAFAWAQDEVHLLLRTLELLERPAQVEDSGDEDRSVHLVCDWCEFSYPFYYDDMLLIRLEGEQVVFRTEIGGETPILFTLEMGSDTGHIVIRLDGPGGQAVMVSITMMTAPAELKGEAARAFHTAQGVVNEILTTIALR